VSGGVSGNRNSALKLAVKKLRRVVVPRDAVNHAYWEHLNSPALNRTLHPRKPMIEVPTAYAIHPKEVVLVPRSVVAGNTNLKRWTLMPRGGHFGFAE
jgi:hypothetical protein